MKEETSTAPTTLHYCDLSRVSLPIPLWSVGGLYVYLLFCSMQCSSLVVVAPYSVAEIHHPRNGAPIRLFNEHARENGWAGPILHTALISSSPGHLHHCCFWVDGNFHVGQMDKCGKETCLLLPQTIRFLLHTLHRLLLWLLWLLLLLWTSKLLLFATRPFGFVLT